MVNLNWLGGSQGCEQWRVIHTHNFELKYAFKYTFKNM